MSTVHHVEVIWEGVIYIDNDDIHTRENNVIGEGVYRPPPPRVEVIRRGYISMMTDPIKHKKTKKK